jgi:hypothetical protein
MKKFQKEKIRSFLECIKRGELANIFESEAIIFLKQQEIVRKVICGVSGSGLTTIKNLILDGQIISGKTKLVSLDESVIERLKEIDGERSIRMSEWKEFLTAPVNEKTTFVFDEVPEMIKIFSRNSMQNLLRVCHQSFDENVGLIVILSREYAEKLITNNLAQYLEVLTISTNLNSNEVLRLVNWILNDYGTKSGNDLSDEEKVVFHRKMYKTRIDCENGGFGYAKSLEVLL